MVQFKISPFIFFGGVQSGSASGSAGNSHRTIRFSRASANVSTATVAIEENS